MLRPCSRVLIAFVVMTLGTPLRTAAAAPNGSWAVGESNATGKHIAVLRTVIANWVPDQYSVVSWERAVAIKATSDFQWFEAAIWTQRDAVHLYKFDSAFDPLKSFASVEDWIAYRESYRMAKFDLPVGGTADERSAALREGFKSFFQAMVTDTPAPHYGFRYSGHGSGTGGLFEQMLSASDTRLVLDYVTTLIGRRLDFADLGGNCSEGTTAVVENLHPYFQYMLASDLPIGGFAFDDWTIETFNETDPDYQLPLILTPARSIEDGLILYLDLRRRAWEYGRQNMIMGSVKQSLSLYQMDQFPRLAELVAPELAAASNPFSTYGYDLLRFIQSLSRSDIESQFFALRISYRSNKDFFTWDSDSNGLAIYRPLQPVCTSFSISPTSASPSYQSGSQAVTITGAPTGCIGGWTTSGNGSWITVSPASGWGSGATVFWTENAGAQRTGNTTIAGRALTVTQAGSSLAPDLAVSVVSLIPTPVAAGSSVNVTFDVTNQGDSAAGANVLKLWLSRDGVLDSSTDTPLAGDEAVGSLQAGQSVRSTATRTLPAGTPGGTWHLLAQVDAANAVVESNETNNTGALSFQVALPTSDFGGDGRSDILWRHTGGALYVWQMDGTALEASSYLPPISLAWTIQGLGDFNGDGQTDVLWRETASGATYLWFMDGATTIGAGYTASQTDNTWTIQGVGDFDGDGHADILWRHSGGALYVWQMEGTATKAASYLPPISLAWQIQQLGDFDGDGKTDILWRENPSGATYVWFMDGASTLAAGYTASQTDSTWSVQGVGDFDADGKSDILWRHTGGALYVWLMNGTATKAASYLPPISLAWQIQQLGDFNGDGKTDILWRDAVWGATYAWLMDGASTIGAGYTASQADNSWTIQAPSATPFVTVPPTAITFGTDVAQADLDTIRLAYSLAQGFWGPIRLSVFAYSSIDAVLDAYTTACGCAAPWYARQELESEFSTTAPNALLVVVGSGFHAMNREILIGSALIHSMTHAIQRGYTEGFGFVGPVWMAEGGAEYADVHAGVRDVEFLHQYGRDEATGQAFTLDQLETWPNNDGANAPFGRAPYNLGHFASDLLVTRSGKSSILSYWQALGNNLSLGMTQDVAWRGAFQSTFGIPVSQFYVEFEAYRALGFP